MVFCPSNICVSHYVPVTVLGSGYPVVNETGKPLPSWSLCSSSGKRDNKHTDKVVKSALEKKLSKRKEVLQDG